MEYEGAIYRPPSEAGSLLVQATIGCSHNNCSFCSMYKGKRFRIRKVEEIKRDLLEASETPGLSGARRIFLCDGNALVMKTNELLEILNYCRQLFPNLERVTSYAYPGDLSRKSTEELAELCAAGLKMIYLGLESGSDRVLESVNKGVTRDEMISCAKKIKPSGIKLSVMAITGLGGQELLKEHALQTASAINEMQPDYLGLLALMVERGTRLYDDVNSGAFKLLSPRQVVEEMLIMLENLELDNCFFSSVHASNYINLRGTLPRDKARLLMEAKSYLEDEDYFSGNFYRRL